MTFELELIRKLPVSLILDVGANAGQSGQYFRQHGYSGMIVSFEPLPEAFRQLRETAAGDPNWICENCALGSSNGSLSIHVSENSVSSSLLKPTDYLVGVHSTINTVQTHDVTVRRLDSIFHHYAKSDDIVLLKVDTQGYERTVVNGALGVLKDIALIRLEAELRVLYEGAPVLSDLLKGMEFIGYTPIDINRSWASTQNGELLEVDVLFRAASLAL